MKDPTLFYAVIRDLEAYDLSRRLLEAQGDAAAIAQVADYAMSKLVALCEMTEKEEIK